jgi:multimeric flavodoxin WrbA
VADLPEHESGARPQDGESCAKLQEMVDAFSMMSSFPCEVINIRAFPMKGGCLGCFHCAADGTCVYTDGFDRMLRERIQDADAVVYAYTIDGHSMGSRFKMFDDRQFCNGHRTVTMGKPVGYLINGRLSVETNLQTVMEARAQVGGNFLAGIACNESDTEETGRQIWQLAQSMEYAIRNDYNPPANFYGVGGMKIFRDLIYQMQGLMREDHRFYKEHGFYDFPQKNKGKVAGMYLVGAMMNNEKLKKKLGGRMTEGMLMPYRSLLKRVEKRQEQKQVLQNNSLA